MDFSSIIGSEDISNKIVTLVRGLPCNIELIGSEGRGKSYILDSLESAINNSNYTFVILRGNEGQKDESYYPLQAFIDRKDKLFKKGLAVFKEAVGVIPYGGKILKSFLEEIAPNDFKSKKYIENVEPFQSHIDFSLHLIGLSKKYEKVVVICDDFHFFDTASVEFITSLQEGFLLIGLPFHITFVISSEKREQSLSLLSTNPSYTVSFTPITSNQLKALIILLTNIEPSDEQLTLIQACSGNHLQLIKIICAYLKENGGHVEISESLLAAIIDTRVKQTKTQHEKIIQLLHVILQSGKTTSTYELFCLLGEDFGVQEILKSAIQLDLLLIKDNQIQFSHPFVASYINSVRESNKASFYSKLGKCIQKLAPSNYVRRAFVSELSMDFDRVDILYSLDYIKRMRVGTYAQDEFRLISNSHLGTMLKTALSDFQTCYDLAISGKLDVTLNFIDLIPDSLPNEIIAEKNFLKSETLAKKIAKGPKEEALRIISIWESIQEDEPEIWYRYMQVKILLAAELGLMDLARDTEAKIVRYFSSRITFDREAVNIIDRLNIFSEILYSPEVAHKKMLQVESKLSNDLENEHFHKLIDLYIARTNLSANSLILSEFDKSISYSESAIQLVSTYTNVRFPYKEVPASNLCLALLFQNPDTLPTALEDYSKIHSTSAIEENKMLIDINYAGLLMMNKEYGKALEILNKSSYIPTPLIDDNFYSYYYWCNHAVISYLLKQPSAYKDLLKVEGLVSEISPILSKYYTMHYQLLRGIIGSDIPTDYNELRNSFEVVMPVFSSRIWNRFKTGYLFTDIQIWTSS